MVNLRARIQTLWLPTILTVDLKTKAFFILCQNGTISNLQISTSSGNSQFDEQALMAIRESVPFPQAPDNGLQIEIVFDNSCIDTRELARNQQIYRQNHPSVSFSRDRGPAAQPFSSQEFQAPSVPRSYTPYSPQQGQEDNVLAQRDAGTLYHRQPAERQISSQSTDQMGESEPVAQMKTLGQQDLAARVPVRIATFKGLTDEQKEDYLTWFDNWLRTPPEERFGFLLSELSSVNKPSTRVTRQIRK